jgi:hypothetical protein
LHMLDASIYLADKAISQVISLKYRRIFLASPLLRRIG